MPQGSAVIPYLIGILIGFPAGAAFVYGIGVWLVLRKKLKVTP